MVYPQRFTCYATRERLAAQVRYDEIHAVETGRVWHDGTETRWSPTRTSETPYRYDHGVSIYVADVDLNPDDDFLS